ncbi:MAG: carbamoyltransferase [Nitrospirae bacterium]|nr:MAG: carbamoyltransferase [Nitrospirota bacterium]
MRILGVYDHMISGAAILEDGHVTAAVNEERLARKKYVMGFPRLSITEVMRLANVKPQEIDAVAVASKWGHFYNRHVDFDAGLFGVDRGFVKGLFFSVGAHLSSLRAQFPVLETLYYGLRKPVYAHRQRMIRKVLREEFDLCCPIDFIGHHFSHACSAYYSSGFCDALVVTMDASGDGCSSHVYEVVNGQWRKLHQVASYDSLGSYYAYVTHICGFTAGKHEGKITGLAAHGKASYRDILLRFIRYHDGTMTNVGNVWYTKAVDKLRAALPTPFSREDLAASIQEVAEDICTQYVDYWLKKTGHRHVALAGGVFANVKINERIHELPGVESIFIHPGMSDEGLAVGASLGWMAQHSPHPERLSTRCFEHVYLGPAFSSREIARALDDAGIAYVCPENYEEAVAQLIAEGYVVARFDGRMEYGPRALGNRSILYRPDDPEANDWLNKNLKRTEFMPFAPVTLAEDADTCYLGLDGARDAARFMTITFVCTPEMRDMCPGVVHVDGTARPQLISEQDNPSYYRILQAFKRLTGLSSVVNTSFNIHEEPIVCTPQDAIRAFKVGHLDYLAIGPFLAKNPLIAHNGRAKERRAALIGQTR